MRGQFSGVLVTLLEQQADHSSASVHLQKALRQMIVDGTARENDRLPSSRALAAELSLSRETVEVAYQQLEMEGFLTRRHGSGTFVAKLDAAIISVGSKRRPARKTGRSSPRGSLSHRGTGIQRRGGVVDQTTALPFAAAMPDMKPFPLDIWRRLNARILRENRNSALMYGDAQGYQPLRVEIARYLAAHRDVRCKPDQIIVLNSSQQALSIIATLFLDPGDHLAMEDPGYHGATAVFAAAGLSLVAVPVDQHGLQVSALAASKENIRAIYLTPSNQYPTGATLSLSRRLSLIDWASRSRSWIIEDDYDSEYRYDGLPISSMQGLDAHERVLYLGTFNKMLFPSLRVAYLVVPEALSPSVVTARTLMDGQSPLVNQMTLAQFMSDGHFTAHIRRMRQLYRARRDAFMFSFERHLSPFASATSPSGGLHVACWLTRGLDESETVSVAASVGVVLPSLRRLYNSPRARSGWLMGFAALTPDQIEAAARRLSSAFTDIWR